MPLQYQYGSISALQQRYFQHAVDMHSLACLQRPHCAVSATHKLLMIYLMSAGYDGSSCAAADGAKPTHAANAEQSRVAAQHVADEPGH